MAPAKNHFAVDVNLLIDRALDIKPAEHLLKVLSFQRYSFFVPPTAIIELEFMAESDPEEARRLAAARALESLPSWKIIPFDVPPLERGYCEKFAHRLISAGFIPEGEFHDGLILAESACRQIPVLITSDAHLTDISRDSLMAELQRADLYPTMPLKPMKVLNLFG